MANELIFSNKIILAGGVAVTSGQPLTLPISASDPVSPVNGDMYYNSTSNTTKIYQNGVWETVSVVGGGGASYVVNKITLTGTDITNKFITLTGAPTTPSGTILDVIGGPTQDYSVDFIVSGSTLSWSGLSLETILTAGDKLIIQFD